MHWNLFGLRLNLRLIMGGTLKTKRMFYQKIEELKMEPERDSRFEQVEPFIAL